MSVRDYKQWLHSKLAELRISNQYLVALAIITERVVHIERSRLRGYWTTKPYYQVFEKDGAPTQAWYYLAEAAIFLKHRGYKPYDYLTAICHHKRIRGFLLNGNGKQVPISVFYPTTRISNKQLLELDDFYKEWRFRNGESR